jgi:hypothetical protein
MSLNANNTYEEIMRRRVGNTVSSFLIANPNIVRPSAEASSDYLAEVTGRMKYYVQYDNNPRIEVDSCCSAGGCVAAPGPVMTITFGDFEFVNPNWIQSFSWTPVSGATLYDLSSNQPDAVFNLTGDTSATITTAWTTISADPFAPIEVTIRAINACGESAPTTDSTAPCFLAGAHVTMSDGTTKVIEDVAVGDIVVGAFGEHNEVIALHRPLLGSAMMCNINGEHSTTNHHPHISADKKFYCGEPGTVSTHTYGHTHEVINASGNRELRMLYGLAPERILRLTVGVNLKTIEGSRIVNTLEVYSMPPSTQLYNLVVGGSHTYHVDGYAVTGWPREDDFDYDAWVSK